MLGGQLPTFQVASVASLVSKGLAKILLSFPDSAAAPGEPLSDRCHLGERR